MLGIKNNEELVSGKFADILFEECEKRYGNPIEKGIANRNAF